MDDAERSDGRLILELEDTPGLPLDPESAAEHERSRSLSRVLDLVDDAPMPEGRPHAGLVAARIVELSGSQVEVIAWETDARFSAQVAPFVEPKLLAEARADGRLALVQVNDRGATLIGFLQTQASPVAGLSGTRIEIDASEELVLRSGRAALRLKADGSVELVGTRISAVSRGVLRLLGRALRLN